MFSEREVVRKLLESLATKMIIMDEDVLQIGDDGKWK